MLSFEVVGGCKGGLTLAESVRVIRLAVSLGGVESLLQHPSTMTHAILSSEARHKAGISDGLLRLSVGIEHVEDIIADLDSALALVPEQNNASD